MAGATILARDVKGASGSTDWNLQRGIFIEGRALFLGGVVSYSNEVKEKALGVQHSILLAHGAVSEETVREMVTGVRNRLGSDYAVATTGIAGPGGGTPDKPVGTVWIGIATPKQVIAKKMHFTGRREQVIERTCNEVYASLIRIVKEELA